MANGLWDISNWGLVLFTLVVCHITLVSVTLYLHRSMAHRALDLHPVVSHFFRFWLWLTSGMNTLEWVAVHRKHHARCEMEGDPHSPVVFGIKKVLLEGAELYQEEARNQETKDKYGHGCPTDWIERNLYSRYTYGGVISMAIIDLALFGIIGGAVFAVQMLTNPVLAAGVINGIGHYWGYRNYECNDASTNITPVAFIIAGEELHNNHHAYPSSAKFSLRPWEFDIGWMYIQILSFFKLAKVRRVAPRPGFDVKKTVLDLDTVKAIVVSRLHVMENYARGVIEPVHKEAMRQAENADKGILKLAKKPLVTAVSRLDEEARKQISDALARSENLTTVMEYRQRLQEIWGMAGANHEKLVAAFQAWCTEAENSGIASLQEFAVRLRGYKLHNQTLIPAS